MSLFFGGTRTTHVYSEGIHFIYPWDRMVVYNVRVQEVFHEFDVLTENGLKVHLFISIRYRPEYDLVGVLHKEVGPKYVKVVVIPEIENVLRVIIGQLNAEEVYTTKKAIIAKSISEAVEQIAQRYVNVDDVIIKKMYLPPMVDRSIQEKIEQKHKADAYKFRLMRETQEKERKRIEAEGLERYNRALTPQVLRWMGINATLELAKSENAKSVVIGGGKEGLPIIGALPLQNFTEVIQNNTSSSESAENPNTGAGKEASQQPQNTNTAGNGGASQQPQNTNTAGNGGASQQPQNTNTAGNGGASQQPQNANNAGRETPSPAVQTPETPENQQAVP